ncbi:hypothetical protein [Hydrogenophaga sp.]|uniref:hypothetical protein n=1 Tax=Hydrogenophaga sp. TaxID=1904254 RepID=UPI0035AF51CB
MIQLGIALFGLTAIYFAMGNNPRLRKWAPIIGLAGQPFWFMATIPNAQWGMVGLCVAYTLVYVRGIWMQWGAK